MYCICQKQDKVTEGEKREYILSEYDQGQDIERK